MKARDVIVALAAGGVGLVLGAWGAYIIFAMSEGRVLL